MSAAVPKHLHHPTARKMTSIITNTHTHTAACSSGQLSLQHGQLESQRCKEDSQGNKLNLLYMLQENSDRENLLTIYKMCIKNKD